MRAVLKSLSLLLSALAIAAIPSVIEARDALPKGEVRVLRVIDGDTVRVSDYKASIRIEGIDAPEIHKNVRSGYKCIAELELGQRAKARLEELVAPPHKVVVEHTKHFDQYGRRLTQIKSDGKPVAITLVDEGLARPWDGEGPKPDWCASAPSKK
jgi:endonuclease YncB( thermonuclease family)